MKSVFFNLTILSMIILLNFSLFSAEEKGKLFFEGTKVVVSANLNTQPEFVLKADQTIDSELFASRIMPFTGNKEKAEIKGNISKCENIECVLSESKKSGVAIFVRSEISFLPDAFKAVLKMYETGHGLLLAEVSMIGKIENPEKQYAELVKEFVAEAQYYFSLNGYSKGLEGFENFTVLTFNPVVDFANFTLPSQQISISEQKETKSFPPEQMTEFHDLSKIKDKKLIAEYENALKADRLGENDSIKAVESWKKVGEMSQQGVIKDFAIKRSNEWFLYSQEIKENELFKKCLESEQSLQLFPEMSLQLWQEFLNLKPKEERSKIAYTKIAFYSQRSLPIKKYVDEKMKLFEAAKSVYSRNTEAIAAQNLKISRKIDLFLKFLKEYGAVDHDFYILDGFINKLPSDKEKELAKRNLYNKWNAEFFKSKCKNKDSQACIISEQLFRKIKEDKEAVNMQVEGCNSGILELCASLAQTKLATPNDPALESLAEKSCVMGSAKGCVALSNFYDIAVSVKPKAKKELLYKVSCERGYFAACKGEVNLESSAAVIKQDLPVIVPQQDKKTVKAPSEPRKPSEFLKTHPYFWYGFSSALAGVALGAVSIYYGIRTDQKYSSYNDRINRIANDVDAFKELPYDEKVSYIKYTEGLVDDGDKYKKIAIGTGVAGGALIVTGIILMAVKKHPEKLVQLSFLPSTEGFMMGASFEY